MKSSHTALPPVTVIMPVRNEAAFIESSLAAVLNQDYPPELLEVLVSDGMSTDGTRNVVQRVIAQLGEGKSKDQKGGTSKDKTDKPVVKLLDNRQQIVPTALNVGIRQAKGEVIIIVGGHAFIETDYVRRCVELLMESGSDCVGGALDSVGTGYVGSAIAAAMSSPFGVGGSGFRVASADAEARLTDSVPFPAYRRDVFQRVGLYNETMVRHQDYEFNYRLRKAGGKILLLPSMRVKYFVRPSFRKLWRQYWQYGLWKGSFLRAYPASLKLRHFIPPVFVLAVIASALLALHPDARLVSWIAPLAYAAFLFVAIIAVSKGGRFKYSPVLPLVFGCLHFSYGIGIWLGLASRKLSTRTPMPTLEPESAYNQVSL